MFVVFLRGLWHGADWTFVLWGLYHGVLLSALTFIPHKRCKDVVAESRTWPRLQELLQIGLTFTFVLVGWIIFRAENVTQLGSIAAKLFTAEGFFNLYGSGLRPDIFVFIGFMLIVEWLQRSKQHALQFPAVSVFRYRFVRAGIYYFLIILMWVSYSSAQEFIYFQF